MAAEIAGESAFSYQPSESCYMVEPECAARCGRSPFGRRGNASDGSADNHPDKPSARRGGIEANADQNGEQQHG
jgi:hypothetical protein